MLWLIKHLGPIPFGAVMLLLCIGALALTDFILSQIEQSEDHLLHNRRINDLPGDKDGEQE